MNQQPSSEIVRSPHFESGGYLHGSSAAGVCRFLVSLFLLRLDSLAWPRTLTSRRPVRSLSPCRPPLPQHPDLAPDHAVVEVAESPAADFRRFYPTHHPERIRT